MLSGFWAAHPPSRYDLYAGTKSGLRSMGGTGIGLGLVKRSANFQKIWHQHGSDDFHGAGGELRVEEESTGKFSTCGETRPPNAEYLRLRNLTRR